MTVNIPSTDCLTYQDPFVKPLSNLYPNTSMESAKMSQPEWMPADHQIGSIHHSNANSIPALLFWWLGSQISTTSCLLQMQDRGPKTCLNTLTSTRSDCTLITYDGWYFNHHIQTTLRASNTWSVFRVFWEHDCVIAMKPASCHNANYAVIN